MKCCSDPLFNFLIRYNGHSTGTSAGKGGSTKGEQKGAGRKGYDYLDKTMEKEGGGEPNPQSLTHSFLTQDHHKASHKALKL